MPLKLGNSAAATDPGRRRRLNEDSYVCEPPLFAVADGIGGAQAGEVASGLAAAALRDNSGDGDGDIPRRGDALIQEANRRAYPPPAPPPPAPGMGPSRPAGRGGGPPACVGHAGG